MAHKAKESVRLREERIAGTSNGMTLRTRVVRDRKKYTRKLKHNKKSIAEAMDFALIWRSARLLVTVLPRTSLPASSAAGTPSLSWPSLA